MDNNIGDQGEHPFRSGDNFVHGTPRGRFVIGLAVGALLAVGIGLLLSPRRSLLRQWLDQTTRDLGTRAAERYGEAKDTLAAAAGALADTAQNVGEVAADTIARGDEAARVVVAVKS